MSRSSVMRAKYAIRIPDRWYPAIWSAPRGGIGAGRFLRGAPPEGVDALAKPSLYLSDFFERHRASYYDSLTSVRQSHDLNQWVRFFLSGVAETATTGRDTFKKILALRTSTEGQILSLGRRAPNARKALDYLYATPATTANRLSQSLGVSKPVAHALIRDFERLDILREITGFERNKVFVFSAYLDLF